MRNFKKKYCPKCKESKPITEFYKNRSRPDGFHAWCKTCHKNYLQSDKGKATRNTYRQSDKGEATLKAYRQSDKFKAALKVYRQSDKGKTNKMLYEQSDNGKAVRAAYEQSDKYIRYRLSKQYDIPKEEITQEMIDAKQAQLKLYREIKKVEGELHGNDRTRI